MLENAIINPYSYLNFYHRKSMQLSHEITVDDEHYSFDHFRIDFHEFCNIIPAISTVTNTIAVVQKYLYVHEMNKDETIEKNYYYRHLKEKDFAKEWLFFIPLANTIFFLFRCCISHTEHADEVVGKNQAVKELDKQPSLIDETIEVGEEISLDELGEEISLEKLLETLNEMFPETISQEVNFSSDFNEQLQIYENLMHQVVYEDKSVSEERIAEEKKLLAIIAKKIIQIEGNAQFKSALHKQIDELVTLKPGRILIRAIADHLQNIRIRPHGEATTFSSRYGYIEIHLNNTFYETLNSSSEYCTFEKPAFVLLAHELIHVLHHAIDPDGFFMCIETKKNIVNEMDNLEEQHTIAGFNPILFSQKEKIKKIDVLCENAFLIALGLPPRINHRLINAKKIYKKIQEDSDFYKDPKNSFFPWVEKELNAIRNIPKDKDDKFIVTFLLANPESISLNLEELMEKKDIILSLIYEDIDLIEYFPDLMKDKEFMLKAFSTHPWAYQYIDEELLSDKEFVDQVLTGTEYKKKFSEHDSIVSEILERIPTLLQERR